MIRIKNTEHAFRLLTKAGRKHHPVTVSYTRADGSETVRTIEVYEITRSKAGDRYAKAMVRTEDGAGELRSFRLDRIRFATVHRTSFLLTVPEPKHYQRPVTRPAADILREIHEASAATADAVPAGVSR